MLLSIYVLHVWAWLISSDFHQKQAAKKALMKKALDKNPDEFYFKMIRTRMEVNLLFFFIIYYTSLLLVGDRKVHFCISQPNWQ